MPDGAAREGGELEFVAQPQLSPVGRPQGPRVLIRGSRGIRIREEVHGERVKGNDLFRGRSGPGKTRYQYTKGLASRMGVWQEQVGLRGARERGGATSPA